VDDKYYTTLKMMDLPDKDNIEKVGNNFFKLKDSTKPAVEVADPSLTVGAVEKSNVNLMDSITSMVITQREFEFQKTTADIILKLVRKSAQEIAKPI